MNSLAACFEPISLDELNARAALMHRIDNKYIVDWTTLGDLVDGAARRFLALEIDRRRVFHYDTVYFDSPALDVYHAHLQERRRRFKLRTRHYVDAALNVFEVKLKGPRNTTVKHQLPIAAADHGTLPAGAERFADEVLRAAYGHALPARMEPQLGMTFRRVTLTARDGAERMTWDFGLSFGDASLGDRHVIVETKTADGHGLGDTFLRDLGARPLSCSKYCAGIGLTRGGVRANPWSRLMRRYFVSAAGTAS